MRNKKFRISFSICNILDIYVKNNIHMGYSNNTHSLPLDILSNLYTDGCGKTYNDKYYVNGAYIDLCGLSIEDYMRNPYCCEGSGSENSKPKNNIMVISFQENGVIYYQAIAKYPVTSNIKINVSNNDTNVITMLDLYVGETHSTPEIGDSLLIKDAVLDIEKDDNYQYTTSINNDPGESEDMTYNVYTKALPLSEVSILTTELIKNFPMEAMSAGASMNMKFTIPASNVDTGDMEEEELNEYCQKNQYSLIIVLPKNIYHNEMYTIFNYGGNNVSNKFTYQQSYVIDDIEYVCLIEKGTDDITPFVPIFGEDLLYEYKLTINK